jgi:hypothetical protein
MLVNSGADVSFITLGVAEILELDLTDKQESGSSASGKFETKRGRVNAELIKGNHVYDLGKMDVLVPVKKNEGKYLNTQALLERYHFFKRFDITFRENILKLFFVL